MSSHIDSLGEEAEHLRFPKDLTPDFPKLLLISHKRDTLIEIEIGTLLSFDLFLSNVQVESHNMHWFGLNVVV